MLVHFYVMQENLNLETLQKRFQIVTPSFPVLILCCIYPRVKGLTYMSTRWSPAIHNSAPVYDSVGGYSIAASGGSGK